MSYYAKNDWRFRSNGLSKSSSQPNYLIPHELNKYNSNYLPLIRHHQQAEIFSNQINKSNRIKNEILNSKYKLFKERGIDNYNRNKYKDSWSDFFKKKEREKQRKKIYKIIQDKPFSSSEEEENANDIFRNGLNSMPTKIEEKMKLKQYLPAKKDLVKLMMKVNDNVNEKVDKNSYLLSKNIRNLENGYDDLKEMIENKINRMERKQEEDFYDLRNYFKRRAKRENNKFNNNLLLENGQNVLNGYDDYNNNDYYKPNMKENIEKLQTYEIAKRIQNIPNLLDNMIENIENIREYRKEQKNDFLLNFNNNFRDKYNDPLYDELDNEIGGNNLRYNNYDNYNFDDYDSEYDFEQSYMSRMTPKFTKAFIPSKPRTEFKRNARRDILSMSKTDIDKLRKNLKPLTYQQQHKKKLDDNEDLLTGRELMEIYKERNSMPKINFYNKKNTNKTNKSKSNNINIQENKAMNKLRESEIVKNNINNINNDNKKDTQDKKDDSDDIVVIGSDNDNSNKEENNKNQKEEAKKNEAQKQSNKEEEKKEESNNSDEDDDEDSNDESKDDNENNNINNNINNNANNNMNNDVNNNGNNNANNNNVDNNKNENQNDDDNKDDDDNEDNEDNEDDDEDNNNNNNGN